jgi:hypothetical protein
VDAGGDAAEEGKLVSLTINRWRVNQGYILDAISGSRLSYGSGGKSDSALDAEGSLWLGDVDRAFVEARIAAGVAGEDKLLRTIPVSAFITAPLRWWVELDTYKVGTVRQSSSLMHRLASRGHFTADDFTTTTAPQAVALVNELCAAWLAAGGRRNHSSPEWVALQDAIPRGYLYTSHWCASYAVLRNIYAQRRHHRQGEWHAFCAWAASLPHGWMIAYQKPRKP